MVIAQCLYIIITEQLQVDLKVHAHIWHKPTTLCKVSDK